MEPNNSNMLTYGPKLEFLQAYADDCIPIPRPDDRVPHSVFAYFVNSYRMCATGTFLLRPPVAETAPLSSEMDDDQLLWRQLLAKHTVTAGIMAVDPGAPWADPFGMQRAGLLSAIVRSSENAKSDFRRPGATWPLTIMVALEQREAWLAFMEHETDPTADIFEITAGALVDIRQEIAA